MLWPNQIQVGRRYYLRLKGCAVITLKVTDKTAMTVEVEELKFPKTKTRYGWDQMEFLEEAAAIDAAKE